MVAGELDICVVYAPQNRPGLTVELVSTERLVLVETCAGDDGNDANDFVEVNWGGDFATRYRAIFPETPSPYVSFDIGTLAFDYLLEHGGRGYFPQSLAAPFLEQGRIAFVPNTKTFSLPVYVTYQAAGEPIDLLQALAGIRSVLP
jgi:DNA-binding transcriptional LysR family regulator